MAKLNKVKYKGIYTYVNGIKKLMNIKKEVSIYSYKSKYINGGINSKGIILSEPLINLFDLNINEAKFIICHELAHFKNDSTKLNYNLMFSTETGIIMSLFRETRADIEGAFNSGLSNDEIKSVHLFMEKYNKSESDKDYKGGYPSVNKRIKYSTKYKEFNEEAKIEICNDFIQTIGINDEKYIKKIESIFGIKIQI